ncbi:UDP-glucose 4-epimerase [Aliiroseovarius halocynthiae]|uniref:UDP-glucose 4-epimerase n=1 Tax=Aliiroseovarius halocynthiae TaxID=985055 RepID=A0A545SNZ5_9RHOB|nr:UDP-glucose 4-epimerase GalE [Aliiroseovarius halocynthiae]TQV66586.1 UDP-glucose 4-epimerase GalE [Aliiroseovarius halocynthiae]SMR82542.1 UDP-glucose 4-epimerase [Aliiroseovarius halocynthiae]
MAQKVLLTGGAGFIGSHTFVELTKAGYQVVILDNFSNADRGVLDRLEVISGEKVTYVDGDVLDQNLLTRVFAEHKFDAVIHFAALKAVGESTEKPLDYLTTNISGLYTLLNVMKAAGVFRLVFSSSATVYGQPDQLPVPETAPRSFNNPYGYTKLVCEQSLEQVATADDRWAFGILRYFNPAGAHETGLIGEDPNDIPNNLMPYIAKVATGELEKLSVFGSDYDTPDGTGVRDYIHVMDLARGHVQSVDALLKTNEGHTVNLGTGTGYSVMDMLRAYENAAEKELPYQMSPRRAGDVASVYGDPAKARDVLGFEAKRGLDDMCESSWNWVSRRKNT